MVENYGEYVDYNSITTQSDRGDMLYTLLDFLPLAGELRPGGLEPAAGGAGPRSAGPRRQGRAAEIWRQAVAERTADIADELPQAISTGCARSTACGCPASPNGSTSGSPSRWRSINSWRWCKPAMDELRDNRPLDTFPQLEKLVERFTEKIDGAGYETPEWLAALEDEAAQVQAPIIEEDNPDPTSRCPKCGSPSTKRKKQLKRMRRP